MALFATFRLEWLAALPSVQIRQGIGRAVMHVNKAEVDSAESNRSHTCDCDSIGSEISVVMSLSGFSRCDPMASHRDELGLCSSERDILGPLLAFYDVGLACYDCTAKARVASG